MPTLEITTMVGCPLMCTYCPQDALRAGYGDAIRNWKYLSLDDFRTVLAKLPPYVRIDFSGMSEPWANPHATEMLAHALRSGFSVSIYTTLYGMTDPAQVIALLAAYRWQVEALVLHLPDRNGNMRGYRPSADYAARLEAFLAFGRSGDLRHFDVMTMDAGGEVHESLRMASLPPWIGNGRAGSLDRTDELVEVSPDHDTPVGCSFTPFYDHNVMLPNGDVLVCCMDYAAKHKIGNLLSGDYWSLFSSQGMSDLRVANMHYSCNESICRKCSRAVRYERKPDGNQFWEVAA